MRPKLRPVPFRKVAKVLLKSGFEISRQSGSHVIFTKVINGERFGLPVPKHEIGIGLLKKIIKQSKINEEKFLELLY